MNSPYSGESASPYSSDQSIGVPSPPTVVTAFNRPYEGKSEQDLSFANAKRLC